MEWSNVRTLSTQKGDDIKTQRMWPDAGWNFGDLWKISSSFCCSKMLKSSILKPLNIIDWYRYHWRVTAGWWSMMKMLFCEKPVTSSQLALSLVVLGWWPQIVDNWPSETAPTASRLNGRKTQQWQHWIVQRMARQGGATVLQWKASWRYSFGETWWNLVKIPF